MFRGRLSVVLENTLQLTSDRTDLSDIISIRRMAATALCLGLLSLNAAGDPAPIPKHRGPCQRDAKIRGSKYCDLLASECVRMGFEPAAAVLV